jgi:hypothetical protein
MDGLLSNWTRIRSVVPDFNVIALPAIAHEPEPVPMNHSPTAAAERGVTLLGALSKPDYFGC